MAHTIIINVSCHQGYHHHHDVVSIMAETHQATITVINIMTPRDHQVISSKAPPSLPSLEMATPTPIHSAVLETQGNRHQFISVTPISICQADAQEGLQEGVA